MMRTYSAQICEGPDLRAWRVSDGWLQPSQLTDANWPVWLLTCCPLASPDFANWLTFLNLCNSVIIYERGGWGH